MFGCGKRSRLICQYIIEFINQLQRRPKISLETEEAISCKGKASLPSINFHLLELDKPMILERVKSEFNGIHIDKQFRLIICIHIRIQCCQCLKVPPDVDVIFLL